MPSVSQIIRNVAQSKRVMQHIVEKDYALSYLLAAIASTEGFGDELVLKGGTALKKLYFPEYRFSEDLDYSTRVVGSIKHADERMNIVIRRMASDLKERGLFQVNQEPLVLTQPHPGDQKAYIVRVQFPEQRQPLCRLKVEITVDEPIITPVEIRPILHGFPEEFFTMIPGYSLQEITVEKLRALLQSKVKLQKRGWGASRVCRDYYDLWNLLRHPGMISPDLIPLLNQKCALRGVVYEAPRDFISEDLFLTASSEWNQQLLPFIQDAPPVDELLIQVKSLILSIWDHS